MMLFVLNDFALPGISDQTFKQLSNDEDSHAVFTEIKEHKKMMTLNQMSQKISLKITPNLDLKQA